MSEIVKTSFLKNLAPQTYEDLSGCKRLALLYVLVLALFIFLSLFFQWSFINSIIGILTGWTIISVPCIGIIIVSLDKEIEMEVPEYKSEEKYITRPKSYLFTKIWGITLLILGISALHFSGKYSDYYSFQCQTFYLDNYRGTYHILKDCEYAPDWDQEAKEWGIDPNEFEKVKGKFLLDKPYELCPACQEWAEDAKMESYDWQYRRR